MNVYSAFRKHVTFLLFGSRVTLILFLDARDHLTNEEEEEEDDANSIPYCISKG